MDCFLIALILALIALAYFYMSPTEPFTLSPQAQILTEISRTNWVPMCNNYANRGRVNQYLRDTHVDSSNYWGHPDQIFSKTFPDNCV